MGEACILVDSYGAWADRQSGSGSCGGRSWMSSEEGWERFAALMEEEGRADELPFFKKTAELNLTRYVTYLKMQFLFAMDKGWGGKFVRARSCLCVTDPTEETMGNFPMMTESAKQCTMEMVTRVQRGVQGGEWSTWKEAMVEEMDANHIEHTAHLKAIEDAGFPVSG